MTEEILSIAILPATLDRLAAETLCRALQDRLLAGQPLRLDGSGVERVCTASLQVLLAASRSAAAREVPFTVTAPSDALIEALADLGLPGALPEVEP
jgi:chemotaxis protein CheX